MAGSHSASAAARIRRPAHQTCLGGGNRTPAFGPNDLFRMQRSLARSDLARSGRNHLFLLCQRDSVLGRLEGRRAFAGIGRPVLQPKFDTSKVQRIAIGDDEWLGDGQVIDRRPVA